MISRQIGTILSIVLILLLGALTGPVFASENPITSHFSTSAPPSDSSENAQLGHQEWGRFLAVYVSAPTDGIARFDYAAVTEQDRLALEAYLSDMTQLRPTELVRAEQIAFWVNLYNTLTVKVVLDHYPVQSIRQINYGRIFARGPWSHTLIVVDGVELSLDDIEHHILRPVFQDPRIHYALNCASLGCPDLRAEPFVGDRLEFQLDDAATTYINHPRGVHVEGDRLTVSSIFVWFKDDFGANDREVIAHLRRYARSDLQNDLEGIGQISRHDYDWNLNSPDDGS